MIYLKMKRDWTLAFSVGNRVFVERPWEFTADDFYSLVRVPSPNRTGYRGTIRFLLFDLKFVEQSCNQPRQLNSHGAG